MAESSGTLRRVVIAAGGTGGHFYPGLVLAKTLRERGWQVLFLTRKADPSLETLEAEGIPYAELDLGGLSRRPSLEWLAFLAKAAGSTRLALRVLSDFQPSVVVGMGGYLTFPAIAAAARQGVPRAVHDSNAVLGLANRTALLLGAKLFWGLPPMDACGGKVTGTPIRPALWKPGDAASARTRLGLGPSTATLLVFGGSQGARGVNLAVPQAAATALTEGGALQVAHLAGGKDAQAVRSAYVQAGVKAAVFEYLSDMETAYAAADLVLCRSGASTLAELAALRKPALLVPYPHASADHQTHNARVFAKAGAAVLVPEEALAERLPGLLKDLLLSSPSAELLSRMSGSYIKLGLPMPEEAASSLASEVEALASGGR
ncbi:MAG: UDP-N-acetylglucosamine--N-acetylmuramyl-(pentapeptide) pyrophosphoryl-undecaprenol N-acetylglucosamine transferase [Elusimicrobia bacterium]|nr:UDP-N-acetylglucosamine--N-acetylmuramyl-(pentapeptide) pyrophosphoryl-undecaprenol N-acetylglucosamine transferase [Elusimicrobiota bacterium]